MTEPIMKQSTLQSVA